VRAAAGVASTTETFTDPREDAGPSRRGLRTEGAVLSSGLNGFFRSKIDSAPTFDCDGRTTYRVNCSLVDDLLPPSPVPLKGAFSAHSEVLALN